MSALGPSLKEIPLNLLFSIFPLVSPSGYDVSLTFFLFAPPFFWKPNTLSLEAPLTEVYSAVFLSPRMLKCTVDALFFFCLPQGRYSPAPSLWLVSATFVLAPIVPFHLPGRALIQSILSVFPGPLILMAFDLSSWTLVHIILLVKSGNWTSFPTDKVIGFFFAPFSSFIFHTTFSSPEKPPTFFNPLYRQPGVRYAFPFILCF